MNETIDHLSTREGYDRWAAIYDADDNPLIALEQPLVAQLMGDVRDLDILDVGCGTGRHSIPLAEAGANVTAIDFSEQMLQKARLKACADLRLRFMQHDLAKPLPLDDASFDRVVCGLVIDHIADLKTLFAEMRRVIRPSGSSIISVMHPAMMLKGVQARFTDPITGRETRPSSVANQISDYVNSAVAAGLRIDHMSEHAVDEALAGRMPRAEKHLGWPLLLLMALRPA